MSSSHGTSAIHFFKRIEEDILRNGELRIPRGFVNECWEGISNPLRLLLPNGAKWNVSWKKHDADIWLTDKWKKFADFYSLDQDHLLVFRYVGKSQFHVVILDQTGLEIGYPLMHDGEENGNNSLRQSKRAKPPVPLSCSIKKLKTNPRKEPKSYPCQGVETRGTQSRRAHTEDSHNAMPKVRGEEEIMDSNRRCSKSKVIQIDEKLSASERARAFSSNSSIILRMQKAYIQGSLAVPRRFIPKHQLKQPDKVILRTFKTWDVKCCVNSFNGQFYLSTGWRDFVKSNNLKLGDVCVFDEIKSGGGISYRVRIFHEEESSSSIINLDSEIPISSNRMLENDSTLSTKPSDERIPRIFVNKHWKGVAKPLLLVLPNGVKWKMDWKALDADAWLIDNWKKFALFYSLDQDHLLVFRYMGKSLFQVVIFNQNGLEIEYPLMEETSHGEEENDNSLSQCNREKSSLPLSPSIKKVKINPKKESIFYSTENPTKDPSSNVDDDTDSKPKKRGRKRIMDSNRKCSKSKAIQSRKLIEDTGSNTALKRAMAFRSENPFFIREMYPSYIQHYFLAMPKNFITAEQQKKYGSVNLWISEGKTWCLHFSSNRSSGQIMLNGGWKNFVKDNDLKIGDVCVFEQIKKPGNSFRVIIFRNPEVSSPSPSMLSDHDDGANQSNERGHRYIFAKRDRDGIPKKCSENNTFELDDSEFLGGSNSSGNQFAISIRSSQLYAKKIPARFLRKHDIGTINDATLRVGNRSWHVKVDDYFRFTSGWFDFISECNLEAGDVCHFELIDDENFVFQVRVTKFID
ncbi:hypothetical protein Fmac_023062 [Flemingia macrophylla]|uniref:TF-B3 domain-containing protein n=1 Tax=Flemingia macrophylla TaxID=520843 RepID=A0ABD1LKF0_9FABA